MYEPRITTQMNRLEDCNTPDLIKHVQTTLEDAELRQELLDARGDDAQEWLDSLQKLAGSTVILTPFQSTIVKTTARLSASSGLCPRSLIIQNVQMDGTYPITGGGSGDVWCARIDKPDGAQIVCLKVMRMYQTSDVQALFNAYFREAIIWKQLNHPNVLPLLGVYFLDNEPVRRIGLVSPWMTRGNLVQYLKDTPRKFINRLSLIRDVASGLSYLHSKKVVHADLKGANILITPSLSARIGDFGLSRIIDSQALELSSSSATRVMGTLRWMARELFLPGATTTRESDVYSFGCVCYEIITGQIPYHELPDGRVYGEKMNYRHPPRPADLPKSTVTDAVWTLMETCWDWKPSERPSASAILQRVAEMEARKAIGRKPLVFIQGEGERGGVLHDHDLESFLEETHPERETFLSIVIDRDDSMTGRPQGVIRGRAMGSRE